MSNSDILHTEKIMEFMMLSSTMSSSSIISEDLWFYNNSISYYSFGYFIYSSIPSIFNLDSAYAYNLVLPSVISLTYLSPLLQGKMLNMMDVTHWKGMSKEVVDFRESTGEEPLWTNSMFSGMPAYQISVKYPNNILLHIDKALQLGFPRPLGVMFLYFLGLYILMFSMKLDYKLAFLASIAFVLSSYFLIILEAGHNTKAHAISYMAPTIAGMLWCFRGKRLIGFFLTFLFLGLQIRANHPQISYYLMFVLFAFWLSYLIYSIRDKKIKAFTFNTIVFVLGCFLAIMINISSLKNSSGAT